MGQLFDLREKAYKIMTDKGLDKVKTGGHIGLKAGFIMALVRQDTPDDPVKITNLKKAIKEVLGVSII